MSNLDIPATPEERREWVKYRLRLVGYSLGALGRELGLSRYAPIQALWAPYPKMERVIADKLGCKPQQIWPERYDHAGRPNRPIGRPCPHVERVNQTATASNGNRRGSV